MTLYISFTLGTIYLLFVPPWMCFKSDVIPPSGKVSTNHNQKLYLRNAFE
ncbi:hypothetical protein M7I_5633 [Glarea lozoyensis 74030]|uniref:Uncharacterized protein n=1 Tax=Glarea lozoyensis (strain ATCC 74030 / MF5533) TaxID=1104152 RepID=H0ESF1_GLAL7|nr:hypothetical protein M7I_5633 [Glarea lozoyensis 74030]